MYSVASDRGFTVRVTSMPYGIQTVWAYLFNEYGSSKWEYLPFWETELIEGFPGKLPRPEKGTTCVRFLLREPVRGIPEVLIKNDIREEDLFSEIIEVESIGKFSLEVRYAKGECHNNKPRLS